MLIEIKNITVRIHYIGRLSSPEEYDWSGSYLLYKLTATVHLRIISHEYLNLQFMINSP